MANIEDTTIAPASRQYDREPTPSRRSLLSFLTAAAVAAPVTAAIAAVPAKMAPPVEEAPEILAIGQQLPALREAYKAAADRKAEALETYEQTRPQLPEEMICAPGSDRWNFELTGGEFVIGGGRSKHSVYRAKFVQAHIIRWDVSRHTKEGKRLRMLARVAKKHEAETKAALIASGYDDRDHEACCVVSQIDELAGQLVKLKPRTMDGVRVYANALLAVEECFDERDVGGMGFCAKLGGLLADGLIRIDLPEVRS